MAIESVISYLVAVAVPVWLVVEQLTRGERPRVTETQRAVRRAPTAVPASRPA